jgi:hypothetical protein
MKKRMPIDYQQARAEAPASDYKIGPAIFGGTDGVA